MSGTRHHRGGEPLLVADQTQKVDRTPVRPAAVDDADAALAWTAEHAAVLWGGCCQAHRRGARRTTARQDSAAASQGGRTCMDDEQFLNSYHNASTPPDPDIPADLAGFMLAADPVLAQAAELARVLARAHQGAATQLIGEGWAHARKYFSLSEKYAPWADYHTPARGVGIHAYAHTVDRPIRLTDEALRAHPAWRNFGVEQVRHPPMRGWLAVPLIGSDGANYGFIQASDRLEGDFTAQDEANLVRLASLTLTALDALAQLHLPEYRAKVANPPA